jgi:hypothetical protein
MFLLTSPFTERIWRSAASGEERTCRGPKPAQLSQPQLKYFDVLNVVPASADAVLTRPRVSHRFQ